jgi:hypothetical protein
MFIFRQNKTLWGPLKLIACLKNWDLGMRLKTGYLKNVAQSLRRSTNGNITVDSTGGSMGFN